MFLYNATGASRDAPPKDYSLSSSKFNRAMNAFSSIAILAAAFGNGILPEIQVINLPSLLPHFTLVNTQL